MAAALSFVDGLWTRCTTLFESGQHAKAKPLLQRLLHLELPQAIRAEAALMLADLLRLQGEYQSARRHVSAALVGDPQDASLHHMLGYLHYEDDEAGDETHALKHLRQAVKLAPDSGECHRALGDYLFHHTKAQRGLNHLRQAVRLEPENLDTLRSLIIALVERDEEDKARQTIRELQFRLGRTHPTVQSLWNELSYASTLKQQQQGSRLSTVPMLKTVSDQPRRSTASSAPPILRFDAGQARPIRPSRRRACRPQDRQDS